MNPPFITPPAPLIQMLWGEGDLGFNIKTAFQPIVDVELHEVLFHEALVRGPSGEGAAQVLASVAKPDRYVFDQACRIRAIAAGVRLNLPTRLSVNVAPNSLLSNVASIHTTLRTARLYGFPVDRLVFEVTEGEPIQNLPQLAKVFREYRRLGVRTAIDDFGAGYSGLHVLADLQPDFVKLDMGLCRNVGQDRTRRVIIEGTVSMCRNLGIGVVAEGIETFDEFSILSDIGVRFFQGYLFARPSLGHLPSVHWPAQPCRSSSVV